MIIGEVVERLIDIKDSAELSFYDVEAIEQACNVLDKLPRMEEATSYEPKQD